MFNLPDKILAMIGGGLAAVLAVALVFTLLTKNHEIKSLNHQLETKTEELRLANMDLGTCRANRVTLQGSIDEQNRAIEALRAASQSREAELSAIAHRARNDAQNASERARRILATPGATCEDADHIILENLQ